MKIRVMGMAVENQEKALAFYTKKLGFVKKRDIPLGENGRWLTVVPKEEQDGPELLLEPSPNSFEPAKVHQKALYDNGIPYTQFNVQDVQKEYERLTKIGVKFSMKPTVMGAAKMAVFDDTCGNNIQTVEVL